MEREMNNWMIFKESIGPILVGMIAMMPIVIGAAAFLFFLERRWKNK